MQQINYGDDKGIDGNDVGRVDGDDDPCHFHFKMSWCVEIQFTVERRQRGRVYFTCLAGSQLYFHTLKIPASVSLSKTTDSNQLKSN